METDLILKTKNTYAILKFDVIMVAKCVVIVITVIDKGENLC